MRVWEVEFGASGLEVTFVWVRKSAWGLGFQIGSLGFELPKTLAKASAALQSRVQDLGFGGWACELGLQFQFKSSGRSTLVLMTVFGNCSDRPSWFTYFLLSGRFDERIGLSPRSTLQP